MNEYELDKSTFIGGWYIPENICNEVIDVFNNNQFKWGKGTVGDNELNIEAKKVQN